MRLLFASLLAASVLANATPGLAQDCAIDAVATLTTDLWASEITYTISDDNGYLVDGQGFDDYSTSTTSFCLNNISGCLTLEMMDEFGDGWNSAQLDISIPALGVSLGTFTLAEGNCRWSRLGRAATETPPNSKDAPTPDLQLQSLRCRGRRIVRVRL